MAILASLTHQRAQRERQEALDRAYEERRLPEQAQLEREEAVKREQEESERRNQAERERQADLERAQEENRQRESTPCGKRWAGARHRTVRPHSSVGRMHRRPYSDGGSRTAHHDRLQHR